MASDADRILLSHARTRGLLTDVQVEEAIDRQLADAAERGVERPIGEVLVEAKWLTADQLSGLLEGDAGEAYRREESRYLDALVAEKVVPAEKVDECRRKLAEDRPRRAAQLLLEEGALTATQHKTLCERLGTLTGRKFGKYLLLERLGTGGMGRVYKAWQPRLDRLVAIKLLPADLAQDPEFVARFQREARALASLNHPNVVAVHDYGEEGGEFHLVMEFVDGVSLREVLAGGKMDPKAALRIVPELCDALEYAHGEGVVHRDIKPENILMDKRGRVKIADFGLAKIVRGERAEAPITQSQRAMGTPHYMAPEQFENPREVDHRADIYSLGVVLYEMLTGELPVGRFEPPSRRAEVSPRLDEVVFKALEKRPERRYQHASEVKEDITRVGGVKVPVWRRLPRRGWAMFAAGFLVAAGAWAILWALARDGNRAGPAAPAWRIAELRETLRQVRSEFEEYNELYRLGMIEREKVLDAWQRHNELEGRLAGLERRSPAFLPPEVLPPLSEPPPPAVQSPEPPPPPCASIATVPFRYAALQDAAFTADSSHAFLTDRTNRCVVVLTVDPFTLDREIPVDGEPLGIACDPEGARVFVTTLAGVLVAFDMGSSQPAWRVEIGAYDVAWARSDLIVTTVPPDGSPSVRVLDPATGEETGRPNFSEDAPESDLRLPRVDAGPGPDEAWVWSTGAAHGRSWLAVGLTGGPEGWRSTGPLRVENSDEAISNVVIADTDWWAMSFRWPQSLVRFPRFQDMSGVEGTALGVAHVGGERHLAFLVGGSTELGRIELLGKTNARQEVSGVSGDFGWIVPAGDRALIAEATGVNLTTLRAMGSPRVEHVLGVGLALPDRLQILLRTPTAWGPGDVQNVVRLGERAWSRLGESLLAEGEAGIRWRVLQILAASHDARFVRDAMRLPDWEGLHYVGSVAPDDPDVREYVRHRIQSAGSVSAMVCVAAEDTGEIGGPLFLDVLCDALEAMAIPDPGRRAHLGPPRLGPFEGLFAQGPSPGSAMWGDNSEIARAVCRWWRYHRDQVLWDPERRKFVGRVAMGSSGSFHISPLRPNSIDGIFADGFVPQCQPGYTTDWSERQAVLLRVAEEAPPLSFTWEGEVLVVTRGDGLPWPDDWLSAIGVDAIQRALDPKLPRLPADLCAIPLPHVGAMTLSPEDPRLVALQSLRGWSDCAGFLGDLLPPDTPNPSALRTAVFLAVGSLLATGFLDGFERIEIGRRPDGWSGPFVEYDFRLVRAWVERIVEVLTPVWPDGLTVEEAASVREFLATLRP